MSNWIEWKGGECPVAKASVIDVRYRNGVEAVGSVVDSVQSKSSVWGHHGDDLDIAAYRIRQEAPTPTIEQLLAKANRHAAKAAKHERKRAELVDRAKELMPEGWGLSEKEGGAGFKLAMAALEATRHELGLDGEPAEDMADPANWKAGDVVEARCHCEAYTKHQRYAVTGVSPELGWLGIEMDDEGASNGGRIADFEWISRPQGESA